MAQPKTKPQQAVQATVTREEATLRSLATQIGDQVAWRGTQIRSMFLLVILPEAGAGGRLKVLKAAVPAQTVWDLNSHLSKLPPNKRQDFIASWMEANKMAMIAKYYDGGNPARFSYPLLPFVLSAPVAATPAQPARPPLSQTTPVRPPEVTLEPPKPATATSPQPPKVTVEPPKVTVEPPKQPARPPATKPPAAKPPRVAVQPPKKETPKPKTAPPTTTPSPPTTITHKGFTLVTHAGTSSDPHEISSNPVRTSGLETLPGEWVIFVRSFTLPSGKEVYFRFKIAAVYMRKSARVKNIPDLVPLIRTQLGPNYPESAIKSGVEAAINAYVNSISKSKPALASYLEQTGRSTSGPARIELAIDRVLKRTKNNEPYLYVKVDNYEIVIQITRAQYKDLVSMENSPDGTRALIEDLARKQTIGIVQISEEVDKGGWNAIFEKIGKPINMVEIMGFLKEDNKASRNADDAVYTGRITKREFRSNIRKRDL